MTAVPVPHDSPTAVSPPVLHADDLVVSDVELVLDGLLTHDHPLGERVPAPAAGPSRSPSSRVALRLPAALVEPAVVSASVVVVDAESTPVAVLREVTRSSIDRDVVAGRLEAGRPGETGLARELRVDRSTSATRDLGREATVVVQRRPLLAADERLLGDEEDVVLVVPVGSATPDGVPPEVLLRASRQWAAACGARVLAAPIAWRDPASDEALAVHVGAALSGRRTHVLRPAGSPPQLEGDRDWAALLTSLQRGDEGLPPLAPDGTLQVLRGWRRPRSERGLVVLFSGLSGSGKSTLGRALAEHLSEKGSRRVSLLDGDVVRRLLSSGLGFGPDDRDLNVRRIGYVAAEVARHGGVAVCAPIAPYERSREAVRAMVDSAGGDFVLVHVSTPLQECERRDLKGLYAKARAGQLEGFTGVSDPYEEPDRPALRVDTSRLSPSQALEAVLGHLRAGGWLGGDA